jgi:ketosteroid isomerase-like protein
MKQLLPIILFASLLFACSTENGDSVEAEIRAEALKDTFVRLNEAATSGDRDAYQNLFLSDGIMFLPDRPPLLGRDAIGKWFQDFRDNVTLVTDQFEQVNIDIRGDVAIVRSRGTGRYILKETGEEFPLRNKFIDMLRFADGEWLFSHHLASSSSLEPGLWDEEWESEGVLPD